MIIISIFKKITNCIISLCTAFCLRNGGDIFLFPSLFLHNNIFGSSAMALGIVIGQAPLANNHLVFKATVSFSFLLFLSRTLVFYVIFIKLHASRLL